MSGHRGIHVSILFSGPMSLHSQCCYHGLEAAEQGQGLVVQGQGFKSQEQWQGLVNWSSRTRTFFEENNTVIRTQRER